MSPASWWLADGAPDLATVRRLLTKAVARCAAFAAIIAFAMIAVPGSIAHAHAELRESVPLANERLSVSPPLISLRFTESVQVLDDAVRLLDRTGEAIPLGELLVDGPLVSVEVPALVDGGYVVDWKVVSADGHPIHGAFTFSVGEGMPVDPASIGLDGSSDTSDTGGLLIVWRALTYAGLAVVLGVWAFVVICWPRGRRDRGIFVTVTIGAAVALVAASVRAIAESSKLDTSLGDLLDLRSGRAWLALVVLSMASLAVGALLRSRVSGSVLVGMWIVAAVAAGTAVAFAGHGANGRVSTGGTIVTVIHVAAMSTWIGGLVALVLCIVAADASESWSAASRYSNIALGSVVVLSVTGAFQAIRQLDGIEAVTGSDYGQALLVKLAIIAGLLMVAGLSRLAVRRSDEEGSRVAKPVALRRSVLFELGIAVAVFTATGWLAGASPNMAAVATGPLVVSATDLAGDATATATIIPAIAGMNSMHVVISTPDGQPPDDIDIDFEPADAAIAPIDAAAVMAPDHVMVEHVHIPFAGTWHVTIKARYGTFLLRTFQFDVVIR